MMLRFFFLLTFRYLAHYFAHYLPAVTKMRETAERERRLNKQGSARVRPAKAKNRKESQREQ